MSVDRSTCLCSCSALCCLDGLRRLWRPTTTPAPPCVACEGIRRASLRLSGVIPSLCMIYFPTVMLSRARSCE